MHDYAGHPFQMELSKKLAERGWSVVHAFFAGDPGPKGNIEQFSHLSGGSLETRPIGRTSGYKKNAFASRLIRDLEYRRHLRKFMRTTNFDVIISGNTPLWVQGFFISEARRSGAAFVFWCQDFYSIAVSELVAERLALLARPVSWVLKYWDKWQFRRSDHIVHITEKFIEQTSLWGVSAYQTSVIPNWGAIDEIEVCGQQNEWQRANVAIDKPVVLYSGSLGLKHNPSLIDEAAKTLPAEFVVVGFGVGYDELGRKNNENVKLLPLQPFDVFPQVLGTATVLVAVIEREAGNFSVPSKVLSYLCAGRPIVLAAPADNLASSIIRESGAGLVVEPEDSQGFTEAIRRLLDDPDLAKSMGEAGRQYAEENFDIDNVASRFEEVFEKALGRVK